LEIKSIGFTLNISEIIGFLVALVVVIPYLLNRNWILNNIIGTSVVFTLIKTLKVPSYKIGALFLVLTFFFDIFWVFYSDRIFG
jgi:hypothetical protein